jgi:hypothetical protein
MSCKSVCRSQPGINTYLFNHGASQKYGNNDLDYRKRTIEVMTLGSSAISKAKQKGTIDRSLFFKIFDIFCKTRSEMAAAYQLKNGGQFGRRRDEQGSMDHHFTIMDREYSACGKQIRAMMARHLSKLIQGQEVHLGNKDSQYHLRLLPHDLFTTYRSNVVDEGPNKSEHLRTWVMWKNLLNEFPNLAIAFALPEDVRPRFLLAEIRTRLGEKLIPTAYYCSILDMMHQDDPSVLTNESLAQVMHMEKKYIKEGLDHLADLFSTAVNAEKKDLLRAVGEFRFKFAMVTPLERGTCAIGEWFENALFHSRTGNFVNYTANRLVELEIFSIPYLPIFIKAYQEMISYEGIPSSTPAPSLKKETKNNEEVKKKSAPQKIVS